MIKTELLKSYNQTRESNIQAILREGVPPKLCYAPFSNLYFGHRGRVTACCENKNHVLGYYPENSLQEIWNGEKANSLREYIDRNNLLHGCRSCEIDLTARNFEGIKAKLFDAEITPESDLRYPQMLEFELSNKCNLECVMCSGLFSSSIRTNRDRLPPIESPYDLRFIEEIEDFLPHIKKANFFGGEPFLIELYYHLWKKIARHNPSANLWVTTNATILNKKAKELLDLLQMNITLSLDSFVAETYHKIRINSKFDRVERNVAYFIDYTRQQGTSISVNTCALITNRYELPDIVRHCNRTGMKLILIPVETPGHLSIRSLPDDELSKLCDYYDTQQFGDGGRYAEENIKMFLGLVELVKQWKEENLKLKKIAQINQSLTGVDAVIAKTKMYYEGSIYAFTDEIAEDVRSQLTKAEECMNRKHPALFPILIKAIETLDSETQVKFIGNFEFTGDGDIAIAFPHDVFVDFKSVLFQQVQDFTNPDLANKELLNQKLALVHLFQQMLKENQTNRFIQPEFEVIKNRLEKLESLLEFTVSGFYEAIHFCNLRNFYTALCNWNAGNNGGLLEEQLIHKITIASDFKNLTLPQKFDYFRRLYSLFALPDDLGQPEAKTIHLVELFLRKFSEKLADLFYLKLQNCMNDDAACQQFFESFPDNLKVIESENCDSGSLYSDLLQLKIKVFLKWGKFDSTRDEINQESVLEKSNALIRAFGHSKALSEGAFVVFNHIDTQGLIRLFDEHTIEELIVIGRYFSVKSSRAGNDTLLKLRSIIDLINPLRTSLPATIKVLQKMDTYNNQMEQSGIS